jgi:hypothetical protein
MWVFSFVFGLFRRVVRVFHVVSFSNFSPLLYFFFTPLYLLMVVRVSHISLLHTIFFLFILLILEIFLFMILCSKYILRISLLYFFFFDPSFLLFFTLAHLSILLLIFIFLFSHFNLFHKTTLISIQELENGCINGQDASKAYFWIFIF